MQNYKVGEIINTVFGPAEVLELRPAQNDIRSEIRDNGILCPKIHVQTHFGYWTIVPDNVTWKYSGEVTESDVLSTKGK